MSTLCKFGRPLLRYQLGACCHLILLSSFCSSLLSTSSVSSFSLISFSPIHRFYFSTSYLFRSSSSPLFRLVIFPHYLSFSHISLYLASLPLLFLSSLYPLYRYLLRRSSFSGRGSFSCLSLLLSLISLSFVYPVSLRTMTHVD